MTLIFFVGEVDGNGNLNQGETGIIIDNGMSTVAPSEISDFFTGVINVSRVITKGGIWITFWFIVFVG